MTDAIYRLSRILPFPVDIRDGIYSFTVYKSPTVKVVINVFPSGNRIVLSASVTNLESGWTQLVRPVYTTDDLEQSFYDLYEKLRQAVGS